MALGEIRLKISRQAYMNALSDLAQEMIDLQGVHSRYVTLKNRLKNDLVGETDDNYNSLMQNVEQNLTIVGKAFALAKENREMLQHQLDTLDANSNAVGEMIASTIETVQSAVNTISLASDLVD